MFLSSLNNSMLKLTVKRKKIGLICKEKGKVRKVRSAGQPATWQTGQPQYTLTGNEV